MNGTSGGDVLRGTGHGDTLAGGAGNDTYVVLNRTDLVVENPGAGIDRVISYAPTYTLTANVENLSVGVPGSYGGGNDLSNVLAATGKSVTLDGGAGNDTLSGNVDTTFVLQSGNGSDVIQNWVASDQIRLERYGITNFNQVSAIMSQVGPDTALNFSNGENLILRGVQASSLTASNFQLDADTTNRTLTFSDEFNSLSLYNPATGAGKWRSDFGYGDPSNNNNARTLHDELEMYVDASYGGTGGKALGINPFSVNNGVLTITAAPTPTQAMQYLGNHSYTSGLLTNRDSLAQEYGYFEVRAKLPEQQVGFWPAFWMLPTDGSWPPELDIFEVRSADPDTVYMTSHGKGNAAQNGAASIVHIDTTQWHTYAVDWGPSILKYYIDGTEVAEQPTPAVMKNKEMFMLLNLAVGNTGGTPASGATAQMQVDFVHAYATANTVSTTIKGVHTVYPANGVTGPIGSHPDGPPQTVLVRPVAHDDSYAVTTRGVLQVSAAQGLLANDTHDNSVVASAALTTGPAHGTVAVNADGSFTYTPTAGYTGSDSFSYVEKDASGQVSAAATAAIAVNRGVIAHDDGGYSTPYSSALAIDAANLLANDSSPGQQALTLTGVGNASHGSVALVNGQAVFTPDAFYSGAASFDYTVTDAFGNVDHATVSLTVGAEAKPASRYVAGTAGSDVLDKSASLFGWMIAGGNGDDRLIGGHGANAMNGGAGNDAIIAGGGADTMTGGTGNDTFVLSAGDLQSGAPTAIDRITDFHSTAYEHDMLRLVGFDSSATLALSGVNRDGSFTYHVSDGANSGDFIVQSSGYKLKSGDFVFA